MDLSLLQAFVLVRETGSLSRTASLMYLTQPAVSAKLTAIEKLVGFRLVVRGRGVRSVTPTPQGERFLVVARNLLRLYGEIDSIRRQERSTLRISAIDSVGTTILPPVCRQLVERRIALTLTTHQTDEAYRLVADNQVDVAFVSNPKDVRGVVCAPLIAQEYYAVRPCAEPEDVREIDPGELSPQDEVFQMWGDEFAAWHDAVWPAPAIPPVRVDSNALLAQYLTSERHWSIIQAGNIDSLAGLVSIQVYRLTNPPPRRVTYLVTPAPEHLGNHEPLQLFLHLLRQHIRASDHLELLGR